VTKHYHLFPSDAVGPGTDKVHPDYAVAWGNRPDKTAPNARGEFWWMGADGIFLIRARRTRECDECKTPIRCTWHWAHRKKKFTWGTSFVSCKRFTRRDIYVGVVYVGVVLGCYMDWWRADEHLCLNCALRFFGSHRLYACDGFSTGNGIGWGIEAPDRDNQSILFKTLLPTQA